MGQTFLFWDLHPIILDLVTSQTILIVRLHIKKCSKITLYFVTAQTTRYYQAENRASYRNPDKLYKLLSNSWEEGAHYKERTRYHNSPPRTYLKSPDLGKSIRKFKETAQPTIQHYNLFLINLTLRQHAHNSDTTHTACNQFTEFYPTRTLCTLSSTSPTFYIYIPFKNRKYYIVGFQK
jgi:hypothetical protein